MSLKDYLADQKLLITTYSLIMSLIVTIIIVDPGLPVEWSSLLYMVILANVIFISYLLIDFYQKQSFFRELKACLSHDEVVDFPRAISNEAEHYLKLLKKQREGYRIELEQNTREKKEWLEYLTSWFHEIKTPISVSRMIYEVEEHSESLAEEMDKVEYYLEQVLYYARLNDFHKDYLIQEIDLDNLMKRVIKSNIKLFMAKNIAVRLNLAGFTVLSDKKGLQFILNQIVNNALKYSEPNSKITITTDALSRTLKVRDYGIGIAAEDLPRIFEKGFTGKNGRTHQKSTGMGLYLAGKMAEKLGAKISFTSKENSYTEATIYFPKEGESFFRKG